METHTARSCWRHPSLDAGVDTRPVIKGHEMDRHIYTFVIIMNLKLAIVMFSYNKYFMLDII